ncbi:Peptidoglycan-binding protein, CsiV [Pseudomonas asturiensis]|uniref:Peptidoglycan-binding protein, CsiV n=1 Tax=Pseudomonas asturiensis TaxID=1190415 RepID=A0A1M7Q5C0_9PSED|nr:CsiV family protein [Pseudomonas asturiensis]SHN25592.1 Peptidoglycan-binding protein, CsiV [Pseudomonas asturiensis]
MRLFRSLTLLLALVAPSAFAEGTYQVEMILFRQSGEPAATRQLAPEDWAAGAQKIGADNERSPALNDLVSKLQGSGSYEVLMQRAWQQTVGTEPGKIAVTGGKEQLGHFPIEGTVSLAMDRFTDIDAQFWVNQLDPHGVVVSSERMKQTARVKNGELTYLDNGNLALLIKVSPL